MITGRYLANLVNQYKVRHSGTMDFEDYNKITAILLRAEKVASKGGVELTLSAEEHCIVQKHARYLDLLGLSVSASLCNGRGRIWWGIEV